jgi:uncharacterized iron-regulated protein
VDYRYLVYEDSPWGNTMHYRLAFLSSFILAGCASNATPELAKSHFPLHNTKNTPNTLYDYQLLSPTTEALQLGSLPDKIVQADVVLIGEWHTHTGIHRFQTDLLNQLSFRNDTALSLEQFSRDKQEILDQYLRSEIGEQTLIQDAQTWPNYESDYRPLIELAKSHSIDVIASNAPRQVVRCIGRKGVGYLEQLDSKQRNHVATVIDTQASPYKNKFMSSMHHGDPQQTDNQFAAQLTWDATMAESIVDYLNKRPGKQVIHIAGTFHVEQGLGIAAQIRRLNSNLKITIITPSSSKPLTQGSDYTLLVLPLPARYVQQENRLKAYQSLHKRNDTLNCDIETPTD